MVGLSTHTLEWIFHWSTICAFIVGGAGLTLALVSAFSGFEVADRLQKDANVKIAEANARAAQADERAAEAAKSAGNLGITVDKINVFVEQKAAETENAIAELNAATARANTRLALIQDRDLSALQIREVGNELRPFAGSTVLVASYRGDGEAARIGRKIVSALTLAGITTADSIGFGDPDNRGGGVGFGVHISGLPADEAFTSALKHSFGKPGRLTIDAEINSTIVRVNGISVHIMVSLKPAPETDRQ